MYGIVVDSCARPVKGAAVALFPSQYNPVKDTPSARIDTTDSAGSFDFCGIDSGMNFPVLVRPNPGKTFSWADGWSAFAAQTIESNGKFYIYCPVSHGPMEIGVAVANSPYGPFTDPIGKPLINAPTGANIDPTAFIDDDGQAYLYWGNPDAYYVKLNTDMISYTGDVVKITPRLTNYTEGPWFYKRNSKYYLAYASHCCPEGIDYAMSSSPTGPWEYKGKIMDGNSNSSGNHPGIIDYKGKTYVFGFDFRANRTNRLDCESA